MKIQISALTLSMALALGLTATPALSQEGSTGQQDMTPEQRHQAAEFSDSELEQFFALQDDIGEIREEYVARIESAESEEEARELQSEAQTKMVNAIEEAGMSVEEYNAIAVAYNSDPSVQERVDALSGG
ncbi:MAG: DUF4168 domain-containing protein [Oleiphilaceae bacterium]|nr:DUF4168 domain-containing protein [Oleiphilaceae bacterium]